MTRYETLRETTRRIGRNGYLEVARKRLAEGENALEFLVVTRGFFDDDGTKRWTRFVTVPDDAETRAWLAEALRST